MQALIDQFRDRQKGLGEKAKVAMAVNYPMFWNL